MLEYKGVLLAKNSDAYEMYVNKQWVMLDVHLAKLQAESKKRGDYYAPIHK